MADDAMTDDAPVIEDAAAMDPADEAKAPVDATATAGDAEEDAATGVADPEPAQKSPSKAQRAKAKVSSASLDDFALPGALSGVLNSLLHQQSATRAACCNTFRAMVGFSFGLGRQ